MFMKIAVLVLGSSNFVQTVLKGQRLIGIDGGWGLKRGHKHDTPGSGDPEYSTLHSCRIPLNPKP